MFFLVVDRFFISLWKCLSGTFLLAFFHELMIGVKILLYFIPLYGFASILNITQVALWICLSQVTFGKNFFRRVLVLKLWYDNYHSVKNHYGNLLDIYGQHIRQSKSTIKRLKIINK